MDTLQHATLLLEDCVEQGTMRAKRVVARTLKRALGSEKPELRNAANDPRYHDWFLKHRISDASLESQRVLSTKNPTKFSIVVPLFHTPIELFSEMLSSVQAQSHANWELILVNASPQDEELATHVQSATADTRIVVVNLAENQGITANTNAGIAVATGDYVCFFDHDDILEPDALFEYAQAIDARPETGLLYCDEDKVNGQGLFFEPHFKPDFDIDLLRSNNYICHFLCVKKSLLDEIGPNDPIYDGAQDHALTLQIAEKTREIIHVPKILYHWRVTPNSTASWEAVSREGVKSYANEAGRAAIQAHLDRMHIDAIDSPIAWLPFRHELDYHVNRTPRVSIVVVGSNEKEANACARSIVVNSHYENYEIIASTPSENEPARYAALANKGAACAQGEFILFLDAGARFIPRYERDVLKRLIGPCQRTDVGAVTGRMLTWDNRVYQAGMISCGPGLPPVSANKNLPGFDAGYFCYNVLTRSYSYASARCLMTHRGTFEAVGGFDERFALACFDADFCLKLQEARYLIIYEPRAIVQLVETATKRLDALEQPSDELANDEALLLSRWSQFFEKGDPHFNPNLCTSHMALRLDER